MDLESFANNIHVRCPSCAKLYSVDRSEVRTEKPQFECIQCRERFWFAFPPPTDVHEVRSYRIGDQPGESPDALRQPERATPLHQISQDSKEHFACVKCGKSNLKGTIECSSCGLVFEKHRKALAGVKTADVLASAELFKMWERVKEDYANLSVHEAFIKFALGQNNLAYASQQYRLILDVNSHDEIAKQMREKILNLATLAYVPPRREAGIPRKRLSVSVWIALVGVFLFVSGILLPQLRPMAPLGGMIMVLGFGFHFVNQKRV